MDDGGPESGLGVLPVGSMFHRNYEVVSCLKAGGMGAVYEVLDHRTRRRRALKLMLPSLVADPELRKRFKLEATVTADIESQHIVETFDAGVDHETGAPFLVMELLKGEDLGAVLERRGPFRPAETVLLLHQTALALDRTHAAGVVHRDLKPENLFLAARDDGSPHVKVLDFGIAKVVAQSSSAKSTRAIGTPLYMAPEQIQGDSGIGPRADLYALGHIAFALLVGEAYWTTESTAIEGIYPFFTKVLQGVSEPASRRASARGVILATAFDAWFLRATARDPARRFDSALELVAALADALEVDVPAPRDPSTSGSLFASSRRRVTPQRDDRNARTAPDPTGVDTLPFAPHAPRPGRGATTSPVSSDRRPRVAGAPPLAILAIIAIAVAGMALLGTAGVMRFRQNADRAVAEPPVVDASEPARTSATQAGGGPSAGASAREGDAVKVAQPADPAATAIPVASSASPVPRKAGPPAAMTRGLPGTSAAAPPVPPASARPGCNPPFTFDGQGQKVWKRECLL